MPAGRVPDVPDQLRDLPDVTFHRDLPDGESGCPPLLLGQTPPAGHILGVVRLGAMRASREAFERIQNPDLRQLVLRTAVPVDSVIEGEPGATISILDADTHHWTSPPRDEELQAYLGAIQPVPEASWISHGRGLKLAYIGNFHADRALAAAFSIPPSFHVELLSHTRHPQSISTQHPGQRCGNIRFYDTRENDPFVFRTVGRPTAETREAALHSLGLTGADRFDHEHCPIDPCAESDARSCVRVLEAGIFCHRCAGHGVRYGTHPTPGFLPYSAVLGTPVSDLDRLADNFVHWTHARLELRHRYPNLSENILGRAYRNTLDARWNEDDPRIPMVFDRDLDFVWGAGLWLDAKHLTPTRVDNDAADGLPYTRFVVRRDGGVSNHVDRVRRSQVKYRAPCGYTPVRPQRGISFARDATEIPVQVPPEPRHPIALLDDPVPLDIAFTHVEAAFPRLDRSYLQACLAAVICGEAERGQPPMLACTGPSGSGKEQHIRLAASFVGEDIVKLTLASEEEPFMRQIGIAITSGHRFLVFDEFGKTPRLIERLRPILQIGESVHWRPLHTNRLVSTPVRAAFFFPSVRFPDFLCASQEFHRRCRRAHLHLRLPNWAATSGGDTTSWRDRSTENARAANSILTHTWRFCHELDFQFL
ncbi:MAG: hypothetical protein FJ276_16510 [Planctomycetes bacterium]|nr:hypothetical protein [Planctomycetota bacterium]